MPRGVLGAECVCELVCVVNLNVNLCRWHCSVVKPEPLAADTAPSSTATATATVSSPAAATVSMALLPRLSMSLRGDVLDASNWSVADVVKYFADIGFIEQAETFKTEVNLYVFSEFSEQNRGSRELYSHAWCHAGTEACAAIKLFSGPRWAANKIEQLGKEASLCVLAKRSRYFRKFVLAGLWTSSMNVLRMSLWSADRSIDLHSTVMTDQWCFFVLW